MDDETTLTLWLSGGPLDGRTVKVDPKDAGRRIECAPHGDGAVALGQLSLPAVETARVWELYEVDPEDDLRYVHVPEDDVPREPGDEWAWKGWGDWSDPLAKP